MRSSGQLKEIFYFDVCGEVNTTKTMELAIRRARELEIRRLVVASETGLSAMKAAIMLQDLDINLIVVTSAAGTRIEKTAIGELRVGIPDAKVWQELERRGATIIRGTDPLHGVGATLEERGVPTLPTLVRMCLRVLSSGTAVCVSAVMMATDYGALAEGEEVVAVAGSWLGLDTGLVLRAANSVHLFECTGVQIREIICKPRNPNHSWPVDQKDWVGDLKSYRRFAKQ